MTEADNREQRDEGRRAVIASLKELLASGLDLRLEVGQIDQRAPLLGEGIGMDSISLMQFVTLVEKRFGFQFTDAEINVDSFKNLEVLAELIATKTPDLQHREGVQE